MKGERRKENQYNIILISFIRIATRGTETKTILKVFKNPRNQSKKIGKKNLNEILRTNKSTQDITENIFHLAGAKLIPNNLVLI